MGILAIATATLLLPISAASAAAPGIPTITAVTALDSSLEVTWTAPSDGGSPITGYEAVAYSAAADGTAVAACTTSSTNCTIAGLTNGTTYWVAVVAQNADGTGVASARMAGTVGARPTVPRSVTVSRILNGLTVDWLAPSSNGGLAITGYTALAYTSTSLTA
ncbi:fibronectin type III domain-containing protein, partial [bacterium]|nr:fibronectin type III domain-containing protein [bacterium]